MTRRLFSAALLVIVCSQQGLASEDPVQVAGFPIPNIDLPDIGDLRLPRPDFVHLHAHWYLPFHTVGFKGGSMAAAFDDYSVRGTMGIMSSGTFNVSPIAVFSLEMEIMGTTALLPLSSNSGADTWSAMTFGLFGAFRFGDTVYAKLRGGWMAKNIYTNDQYRDAENDRTAFPVGAGIGWRISANHVMEIEATYIDRDLSMLSFAFIL
ncbi:MAG: hypothetical protein OEY67_11120 [Gammaproteobacteria bacterium]|nr:hypothetical protein [Gammaproteobacteria bacterium]